MWESIIDKSLVMTLKIENNLTRKEAEQIIHLMSWAVEESKNELIRKDFKRLSDRLMELTRDIKNNM